MIASKTLPKTDKQLQLDVLADIARDFRFKPAEVGVEVDAGVVTLTGTVSSYFKLGMAADIAGDVPGVKDVANKLTVVVAPLSSTWTGLRKSMSLASRRTVAATTLLLAVITTRLSRQLARIS